MNYADIKQYDIANGPGVRISLFVSGCTHRCRGCFNPETWDYNYGRPFTEETIQTILDYLAPEYIDGLTLLGGEPFEHSNQQGLLLLLRRFRARYQNDKTVWAFTGYDFEKDILSRMIPEWQETEELLSYLDVLVDGEFMEAQKDLSLRFKGSSNQRTISVPESLSSGTVCLLY